MKILMLGGIGEALALAEYLSHSSHELIYSLVGKGDVPNLDCPVRVGGFGGFGGMVDYLRHEKIELLLDITHPYADTISLHAFEAAAEAGIELWAYQRPLWEQQAGDRWIQTPHWYETLEYSNFKRPFITLGSSVQDAIEQIPKDQHWLLRALPGKLKAGEDYDIIDGRGPFSFEDERQLLIDKNIDVIVAKNSGGNAVSAKITAARELDIPVIMQSRPQLPEPERIFFNIDLLTEALAELPTS